MALLLSIALCGVLSTHVHTPAAQHLLCNLPAGELLGAGSFGRVYRGRWNGMEVAVKVIEHDASSAMEVENEVLLLMGLQHECIVAAYHYVTYSRGTEAQMAPVDDNTSSSCDGSTPARDSGPRLPSSGYRSSSSGQTTRREPAAKKQKAESHLVMEFCDCGTLTNTVLFLRQQQQLPPQQQEEEVVCAVLPQVLLLLQDVARGLQAIHSKNIVHGDLVSQQVQYTVPAASSAQPLLSHMLQ
jgi:serine/threonine protein kinase